MDRNLGPDPILGLSVKYARWVCLASGGKELGSAAFPAKASLLSKPVSIPQIRRRPMLALMLGTRSEGVCVCVCMHMHLYAR